MAMTTVTGHLRPPAVPPHPQSLLTRSSQRLVRLAGIGLFASILTACASPQERMFMQQCTGGGNPALEDQCECAFDKITERYSEQQLEAMSMSSQIPPEFEQVVIEAGMSCSDAL